ncbi:MAG: hypothetical protein Q7S19_03270 [bacterium]|nr:hypothetical protein [bacterium]
MKIEEVAKIDMAKLINATGLTEEEVLTALRVSNPKRWLRDMKAAKTIGESRRVYDAASDDLENKDPVRKKILYMHEARCQAVVDQKKIDSVEDLYEIVNRGIVDGPAFTKAAWLLVACIKQLGQFARLYRQLIEKKSTNDALITTVAGEFIASCMLELEKPTLTMEELYGIRAYSSYLPPTHPVRHYANKKFKIALGKFLSEPRVLTELTTARGWAREKREFSRIDSLIFKIVVKECENNPVFANACEVLVRYFNLIGPNSAQRKCLTILAGRAQTFDELRHVFDRYSHGSYLDNLRRKMIDKLVALASTVERLMFIYERGGSGLVTSANKRKIIQKLAKMYTK